MPSYSGVFTFPRRMPKAAQETEQRRRRKRDQQREHQHAGVDADAVEMAERDEAEVVQHNAIEQASAGQRDEQARAAANYRQQQAFGKQLAHDAQAARAVGRGVWRIPIPDGAARQHEVRHIDAGNQEISLCLAQGADRVEIERMTHAEIHDAIHKQGKTTVLIYNGGTEQRGPHAVLGGHTFMARRTAEAIARRLGNALVAPVLPFSPAGSHLNPKWPGSVDLPPDLYAKVNEAVVASMVTNGFRNVVLMGDHGGGQQELASLAGALNKRYAAERRARVFL